MTVQFHSSRGWNGQNPAYRGAAIFRLAAESLVTGHWSTGRDAKIATNLGKKNEVGFIFFNLPKKRENN